MPENLLLRAFLMELLRRAMYSKVHSPRSQGSLVVLAAMMACLRQLLGFTKRWNDKNSQIVPLDEIDAVARLVDQFTNSDLKL